MNKLKDYLPAINRINNIIIAINNSKKSEIMIK